MSGVAAVLPKYQFFSASGAPLVNGTVDVYIAGSTTRTPTWQDAAQQTLNQNPVQLDSRGECVLFLDPTIVYKFVLKNAGGVQQWTVDDIAGDHTGIYAAFAAKSAITQGSGLVGHSATLNYAVDTIGRTLNDVCLNLAMFPWLVKFDNDPANATANAAAIQAAIAFLPATGGELLCPRGVACIDTKITAGNGSPTTVSTRNNIRFRGQGAGASAADSSSYGAATAFKWTGAAGGTMLEFAGPISACAVQGIYLDCNALAATGLDILHAFSSRFADVVIARFTGTGLRVKSRDVTIAGMVRGCDDNIFDTVKCIDCSPTGGTAVAADFGSDNPEPGGVMVGMSRCTFINCFFVGGGTGSGLILRYFDNNVFIGCSITTYASPVSGGNALKIIPPFNAQTFPMEVVFYNCPIMGTRAVASNWTELGTAAHGITIIGGPISDDSTNDYVHENFWGTFRTRTRLRQALARLTRTNPQPIPNAVETAVSWEAENFDTDFLNGAGQPTRLTATVKGAYEFTVAAQLAAAAGGARYVKLVVNGAASYGANNQTGSAANDTYLHVTDTIYLNRGDYVEALVYQDSGGGLDLKAEAGTYMTCKFVGA
jgi:hypothetical protein